MRGRFRAATALAALLGFAGLRARAAHVVFRGFVPALEHPQRRLGGAACANKNQFGLSKKHHHSVVETWFAAELDALTDTSRKKWLAAIGTLVDWEMWQSLRTYPNRSVNGARELLALLLESALTQMEAEAKGKQRR